VTKKLGKGLRMRLSNSIASDTELGEGLRMRVWNMVGGKQFKIHILQKNDEYSDASYS